jgi:hypothetical protein
MSAALVKYTCGRVVAKQKPVHTVPASVAKGSSQKQGQLPAASCTLTC